MLMDEDMILCPCCGHRLFIYVTEDGIAVQEVNPDLSQPDIQKIASALGVEIGTPCKGGE